MQFVLSLLNDFSFIFSNNFLLQNLLLELFESLNLVIAFCKLLDGVLVLFFKENLQLVFRYLGILYLVDLSLRKIYNLCRKGIAEDFIINVMRSIENKYQQTLILLLWDGKQVALGHVVLYPEVSVIEYAGVVKRIFLWEEISNQFSVFTVLGWVRQV